VQDIRHRSGAEVKIDHLPTELLGSVTIIGDVDKTEQMVKDALSAKGCPLGIARPPSSAPLALPPSAPAPASTSPGGGVPVPVPPLPAAPSAPAVTPALHVMAGTMPGTAGVVTGIPGTLPRAPSSLPGPPREVQIPPDLVGGLIGPGGSCINELRQKAGGQVFISVLPPVALGGPQIARISGPEHPVFQAEAMVNAKLEELRAARNPKLPPPPPPGGARGGNLASLGICPVNSRSPDLTMTGGQPLSCNNTGNGMSAQVAQPPLPGVPMSCEVHSPAWTSGSTQGTMSNLSESHAGEIPLGIQAQVRNDSSQQLSSVVQQAKKMWGGPPTGLPASMPSQMPALAGPTHGIRASLVATGASAKCGLPPRPPPPPSNAGSALDPSSNGWVGKGKGGMGDSSCTGGCPEWSHGGSAWTGPCGLDDSGPDARWSDMSPDRGFSNEDPWAASVGLASGPAQEASAWKSGPTSWCAQSASQGGPWEGDLVYRGLGHGAVLE